MGAVRVQTTNKISWATSPSNGSFGSLPAIGNAIIIVMSGAGASIDFSAVSDNQGGSNTYTKAVQSAAVDTNRARCAVWYCQNVLASSGTFTVTVTSTAGQGQWAAVEYSGMATTNMFDVATSNRASTAVNPTSGTTATTAQADEVVASSMCCRHSPTSITVDSGTQEYEALDFATDEPGEGDTKIISSTGTQQTTWTLGVTSTNGWAGCIATFKVSSGTSAGTVGMQPQMFHPGAGVWNIARFRSTQQGIISGPQLYLSDLTASVSFVGSGVKVTARLQTGALSFIGSVVKRTAKPQTGTLSFIGDQTKRTGKVLSGAVSFLGSVVKFTSQALTGAVSFIGSVVKRVSKIPFTATLSFLGTLVTGSLFTKVHTAAVSFIGAISKQTNKPQTGAVSFVGSISRLTMRFFTAGLSFIGAVSKLTSRTLTGALSFSASLAKRTIKGFSAGITFIGALSSSIIAGGGHLYTQALTAAVSFSGSMGKGTRRALTGILGTTGTGTGDGKKIIMIGTRLALKLKGILYEWLE